MLKTKVIIALMLTAAVMFSGCATRSSGVVGESIKVTEIDFSKVVEMKKGSACMNSFLTIPIGTDDSLLTAASNAGIKKVHYVEEEKKETYSVKLFMPQNS